MPAPSVMVDRVAKAIYTSEYDDETYPWANLSGGELFSYRGLAHAAIAAMREPPKMIDAAYNVAYSSSSRIGDGAVVTHWRAMIDAALAEDAK